jgi:hypothetical protein
MICIFIHSGKWQLKTSGKLVQSSNVCSYIGYQHSYCGLESREPRPNGSEPGASGKMLSLEKTRQESDDLHGRRPRVAIATLSLILIQSRKLLSSLLLFALLPYLTSTIPGPLLN